VQSRLMLLSVDTWNDFMRAINLTGCALTPEAGSATSTMQLSAVRKAMRWRRSIIVAWERWLETFSVPKAGGL